MMARQGFPVQWAQYLMHVWGKQSRWLTWSGETLSAPDFVSTSVPQGDPCAPATFTILLQQGADELQAALQDGSCQALFIDDRNVIVFSTQDVIRTLAHWESWCTRLGLKENRVKARFVARDPAQAQALRAGIGPELFDFRQAGGLGIIVPRSAVTKVFASWAGWLVRRCPLSKRKFLPLRESRP